MSASQAEHAGSIPVTCSSSETPLWARSPAFRRGFLAGRGVSSLPNRTRLRWASIWGTLGTSEQASYRLLRLFQKSECAHSAAPPFQAANASLVCGLRTWSGVFFVNTIKKAGNLFRGSLQCVYLLYARPQTFLKKVLIFKKIYAKISNAFMRSDPHKEKEVNIQ